ncbi:hypothetical protein LCI18_000236 [Fusarium solani-melongenae]|uniref:Uncharacterized protein n=1 Tax=Fusarium solani subsp. cucurbitae TaxID=2747967 RepID=A0ACD3YL47_FUSSC|nr:hypothetical protein LCI18_000236 [Fusarium solani-melongenae]
MDQSSPLQPDLQRNRLPTLFEVLSRRVLPPVDLFSFYVYMRDQQRSVDYLDFCVSTILSRTRHFFTTFKSRRGPKTGEDRAKHLTQLNLRGGASNSSLPTYGTIRLANSEDVEESAANSLERDGDLDQRVSAFLRGERVSSGATPSDANDTRLGPAAGSSTRPSTDQGSATAGTISRQDIRASAEKIIYTYVLPGAEREIILPGSMTEDLVTAVEGSDRDDPEVFDVVKDYVFKAMERDAFPGFLRMRALANLTPPTIILHLVLGLLSLFAAFWVGFVLIFLDMGRKTRAWLILPFTIGVYSLAVYQYALDPTIALLQLSEYTLFGFVRVREPYVKKILSRRGIFVLVVILTFDAALSTLFIFVPGKRL